MDKTATDEQQDNQPLGLSLHDQLVPLLEGWANVECVRFVNRSTRQRTTDTVSRDGLLDLMRAAQAAERERHRAMLTDCKRGLVQALNACDPKAPESFQQRCFEQVVQLLERLDDVLRA